MSPTLEELAERLFDMRGHYDFREPTEEKMVAMLAEIDQVAVILRDWRSRLHATRKVLDDAAPRPPEGEK